MFKYCAIALIVLLSSTAILADTVTEKKESRTEQGGGQKLMEHGDVAHERRSKAFEASVKELDFKRLEGKWLQYAGSLSIHRIFLKDCSCPVINYKLIDEKARKFLLVSTCKNDTSGKVVSVNGTMTQVDERSPGAFRIEVIETEHAPNIPEKFINKTEKQEVKDIAQGQGQGQRKEEKSNIQNVSGGESQKQTFVGGAQANAYILQIDKDYSAMLMVAPDVDAVWILTRRNQLDEQLYNSLVEFAQKQGFTTERLQKFNLQQC